MLALPIVIAGVIAASPTEGVLLGLSHSIAAKDMPRDGVGHDTETWIATPEGLVRLGTDLAVPRKDGWYRLRPTMSYASNLDMPESFQRFVLEPASKPRRRPKPVKRPRAQDSEGIELYYDTVEHVRFVNEDYVTIDEMGDGFGGSYPLNHETIHTLRVTSKGLSKESVAIGDVLGEAAQEAFLKQGADKAPDTDEANPEQEQQGADQEVHAEKANPDEERPEEDECEGYQPASKEDWGLERDGGRWIVTGGRQRSFSMAPPFCSFTFQHDGPLPASLVGQEPRQSWVELSKQVPSTPTDIVTSPSGRLAVVITEQDITLLADGKVVQRVAMKDAKVVMIQPVSGAANVSRWRKEAAAALR